MIETAMIASCAETGGYVIEKRIDNDEDSWSCLTTGIVPNNPYWVPIALKNEETSFDLRRNLHTRLRCLPSNISQAAEASDWSFEVVRGLWNCRYPTKIVFRSLDIEDQTAFIKRLQAEAITTESFIGFIVNAF